MKTRGFASVSATRTPRAAPLAPGSYLRGCFLPAYLPTTDVPAAHHFLPASHLHLPPAFHLGLLPLWVSPLLPCHTLLGRPYSLYTTACLLFVGGGTWLGWFWVAEEEEEP